MGPAWRRRRRPECESVGGSVDGRRRRSPEASGESLGSLFRLIGRASVKRVQGRAAPCLFQLAAGTVAQPDRETFSPRQLLDEPSLRLRTLSPGYRRSNLSQAFGAQNKQNDICWPVFALASCPCLCLVVFSLFWSALRAWLAARMNHSAAEGGGALKRTGAGRFWAPSKRGRRAKRERQLGGSLGRKSKVADN